MLNYVTAEKNNEGIYIGSYLDARCHFVTKLGEIAEEVGRPVTGKREGEMYVVNSRQHAQGINDAADEKFRQTMEVVNARARERKAAQDARIAVLPEPLRIHAASVLSVDENLPHWENAASIAGVCKTIEEVEKYRNLSVAEQAKMVSLPHPCSMAMFNFQCNLARMVCNGGYES